MRLLADWSMSLTAYSMRWLQYHSLLLLLLQGNPWSAYGETVIVTVQSLLIVVMLWAYDTPDAVHMATVTGFLAMVGQVAWNAPEPLQEYVMSSTTILFILSRGWQIAENVQAGSTGQLAFLTLFMNFAGAAARIFTTLQEVKQVRACDVSRSVISALID